MPSPHWFPFYHGDWIRSVSHLPLDVQGAYIRLLCHQWEHGGIRIDDGKIDIAQVARICGVTRAKAVTLWNHLVHKFTRTDRRGPAPLAQNERLESLRGKAEEFFRRQKEKSDLALAARKAKAAGPPTGTPAGHPGGAPLPQPQPDPDRTGIAPRSRTAPPQKPGSAGHTRALALVQPRDKSAFWEGPIFNIPLKWAAKTIKAANGALAEDDLVEFAQAVHEKAEHEHINLAAVNLLAWLDEQLRAWLGERKHSQREAAFDAAGERHLAMVRDLQSGKIPS